MRRLALAGAAASRRVAALPLAGISLGSALFVALLARFGALSLPGLTALAALGAGALLLLAYNTPWLLVIATPAILPLGNVWTFLPFECALYLLAGLMIVRGSRTQAPWLFRLQPVETAYLALILWAAFTGLWCDDFRLWMWGIRRIFVGVLGFWVGYRLAYLIPRRVFEIGIPTLAITLSLATLRHYVGTGLSGEAAMIHRADATNLGWGWANYIAALLVLLTPAIMLHALHSRDRLLRVLAWPSVALMTVVQGVSAARGGLLLFIIAVLAPLALMIRRRRLLGALIGLGAVAGLLFGPWGEGILNRFTSLKELSSMTIRIWYFREGWRRTLAALPWGIGVNQGPAYPDHLQGLDPHDYWLVLSSELGILGVIGWIVVLVVLWRTVSRLARDREWVPEARALQLTFVLANLHALVEPTFQGAQYQFVFFWILGGYVGFHALRVRMASERALRGIPAASSSAS